LEKNVREISSTNKTQGKKTTNKNKKTEKSSSRSPPPHAREPVVVELSERGVDSVIILVVLDNPRVAVVRVVVVLDEPELRRRERRARAVAIVAVVEQRAPRVPRGHGPCRVAQRGARPRVAARDGPRPGAASGAESSAAARAAAAAAAARARVVRPSVLVPVGLEPRRPRVRPTETILYMCVRVGCHSVFGIVCEL
jgi:hypothetical protein